MLVVVTAELIKKGNYCKTVFGNRANIYNTILIKRVYWRAGLALNGLICAEFPSSIAGRL